MARNSGEAFGPWIGAKIGEFLVGGLMGLIVWVGLGIFWLGFNPYLLLGLVVGFGLIGAVLGDRVNWDDFIESLTRFWWWT